MSAVQATNDKCLTEMLLLSLMRSLPANPSTYSTSSVAAALAVKQWL